MINMFKVGDRVRCISAETSHQDLELNQIYTITDILKHTLLLKEIPNYGFYPSRFELAYIKEFSNKLEELINE